MPGHATSPDHACEGPVDRSGRYVNSCGRFGARDGVRYDPLTQHWTCPSCWSSSTIPKPESRGKRFDAYA